jgi:hypothetical protein
MLRRWLLQLRQRPEPSVSPETLDAWEARPLALNFATDMQTPRKASADTAMETELVERETVSAQR